jgi:hypothetical protein
MSRAPSGSSAAVFLVLGVALGMAGCQELDFDERSLVKYDRMLAVVVDPPVFRSGDVVEARALVVTPAGEHLVPDGIVREGADGSRACDGRVCFDWAVCLRPERSPGSESIQYTPETPSQGCEGAMLSMGGGEVPFIVPQSDGSLRIDTTPIGSLVDAEMLEALAAALGLPEALVTRVLAEVGLPIVIELRVFIDGVVRVGYKRALLLDDGCTADCTGQNPPPPQLAFSDANDGSAPVTWVTGRGAADPFECVPCERSDDGTCVPTGAPLALAPSRRYLVAPEEDVPDWLEAYTVLDLTGELVEGEEFGYFSFFATAGALQEGRTRYPAAEEIFTAPATLGEEALWVVARDGHYGTSACRVRIRIE